MLLDASNTSPKDSTAILPCNGLPALTNPRPSHSFALRQAAYTKPVKQGRV